MSNNDTITIEYQGSYEAIAALNLAAQRMKRTREKDATGELCVTAIHFGEPKNV
jgi:hypothetical protein